MISTTTRPTHTDGLRVVQLTAENYKRLTAVDITPDPDNSTVVIGGRNAQGKSSVLDALWSAIRGTDAAKGTGTTRPIHDGAETATVRVDLGELVVTRTWKSDKSTLTVTSAEGAKYSSPQKMLDDLVGAVSFDPLAFTRASSKQQAADLAALAGLGDLITDTATRRAAIYEERTATGRALKQAEGNLATIFDEINGRDLPDEPVDVVALMQQARDAQAAIDARADDEYMLGDRNRQIEHLERQLDDLREEAATIEKRLAAPATVTVDDLAAIEGQIANSREAENLYRLRGALSGAEVTVAEFKARRDQQTADIDDLDTGLREKIAAATFPVEGLGFDPDGQVTHNGIPFSQSSAAEQMRVSVAMAMAANPRLRVIRIADGSLLDDDSMRMVEEMATAGGFQVWIERVGDPGEIGVLIEDGQVQ